MFKSSPSGLVWI
ncbi:hypothetical protein VC95412_000179A, partial [Vibrio cholerae O1 str. 95412]